MGKRILVVDDDTDTTQILAELLAMEGHVVLAANTPEHALAAAEDFDPELVILDVGMPNIDGYELAVHLRFKVAPDCRFVMATGFAQDRLEQGAVAGFTAHFTKPIDFERLLALAATA